MYLSNWSLRSSTIAENDCPSGPSISNAGNSTIGLITDSILWDNSSWEIAIHSDAIIDVSHSDIRWGYEGIDNIDELPGFVDSPNGDFHLTHDSPCIDSASIDGPNTDFMDNPRPQGLGYDMGAFEFLEVGEGEGLIEGEGLLEGEVEGEGVVEGIVEGQEEGTIEGPSEGQTEGLTEGEGLIEGQPEGEGAEEGVLEGQEEGVIEGQVEGLDEGQVEGEVDDGLHTADQNGDGQINLSELLRVIQFFNSGGYHCLAGTEDGYSPSPGPCDCSHHDSDYSPHDWRISVSELLRVIQFFNSGGYHPCEGSEDGYCPRLG